MKKIESSTRAFEAAAEAVSDRYELCLFIAGMTPLSRKALENLLAICNARLVGKYDLTVVDIYQEPARAKIEQVVATPTLLKKAPGKRRMLVGDLSDVSAVLRGLDLERTKKKAVKKTAKKKRRTRDARG
ncbi:MAG TPA: circadian clock KaiB family protein [Polyangiaceae bacterium]